MSVSIAPQFTQRHYSWSNWKAQAISRGLLWQHDDDGGTYTIWGYDGPEVHLCTIYKGSVPDGVLNGGYSQEQNDLDKADWEANYKPASNGIVENKAKDGRLNVRMTAANTGRNFRLRAVSLYTADSTKMVNKDPNGNNHGDMTYKLYDSTGTITADPALACRTTVDFEPPYTYDIIGGFIDIPQELRGGDTDQWFVSVIAVPDVPAQYGGSIDFVSKVNLECVSTSRVTSDGRACSTLKYDPVYHTNKIRFIFDHPAGASKRFQVYLELFK